MSSQSARATIADVAAAAGVSRTTVSVALSGRGRVDERTRERIKAVAKSLNYRPSVRAQRLRGGASRTVGLVTALSDEVVGKDSHMSFLLALGVPVARQLLEKGYSTLLLPPLKNGDHLDAIDVDAVVVIDPREHDPLIAGFRSRGMQVVAIGDAPGIEANGVVDRGMADAAVAIGHLIDRGAVNIAVLSTAERHAMASSLERYVSERPADGVRLRLEEISTGAGEDGGRRRTLELLSGDPSIDAVYAPIDAFAVGAVHAAHELGKRIPEDVMIITNYDGPRANATYPRLTALDLQLPAFAEAAVALLIECLDSPRAERRVALAPRPGLRVRASTSRVTPERI